MWVQLVKKRTDKQLAKCIAPILERWLKRLDLYNTWFVRLEIVCGASLPEADDADSTVLASIDFSDPYKRAEISLNRELAATMSDADLDHNLLHELVHVLMRPMVHAAWEHIPKADRKHFQRAHESVTDTFTNLLLWDSKGERNR